MISRINFSIMFWRPANPGCRALRTVFATAVISSSVYDRLGSSLKRDISAKTIVYHLDYQAMRPRPFLDTVSLFWPWPLSLTMFGECGGDCRRADGPSRPFC
jgi:hypothetical protein